MMYQVTHTKEKVYEREREREMASEREREGERERERERGSGGARRRRRPLVVCMWFGHEKEDKTTRAEEMYYYSCNGVCVSILSIHFFPFNYSIEF